MKMVLASFSKFQTGTQQRADCLCRICAVQDAEEKEDSRERDTGTREGSQESREQAKGGGGRKGKERGDGGSLGLLDFLDRGLGQGGKVGNDGLLRSEWAENDKTVRFFGPRHPGRGSRRDYAFCRAGCWPLRPSGWRTRLCSPLTPEHQGRTRWMPSARHPPKKETFILSTIIP